MEVCNDITNKSFRTPQQGFPLMYIFSKKIKAFVNFVTYCNFSVEEVLECQHQTTDHFSQKQGIYAPFKH
jgi:hypothetical protein